MSVGMQPPADALVLFGATGDLAKRKLFPALYHLERHGTLKIPVIGVARSDWTDEAFCQNAHDAIIAAIPDAEGVRDRFADGPARPHPGRLRRPQDVGVAARARSTGTRAR